MASSLETALEPAIDSKQRKADRKINDFSLGFSIRTWSEKGFPNQPKWSPSWSKIDSRRELEEKTGKV
jgi:hypothetical protein